MNTTRKSLLGYISSALVAFSLGASLLPDVASANDGTVTFTGTIYESPCEFSDANVTCYAGTRQQTLDLASLQHAGSIKSISSTLNYKLSDTSRNVAIVTVSYL